MSNAETYLMNHKFKTFLQLHDIYDFKENIQSKGGCHLRLSGEAIPLLAPEKESIFAHLQQI